MIQEQRLVGRFMELVKVDSETGAETEISEWLKQAFRELGLAAEEDDAAAKTGHGAGNLYVSLPAAHGYERRPRLLFTCHMDTVTPGKGVKPQLDDDGYIRSDGTTILGSDDKAGIAALLEAVQAIREQNMPHGPVQLVITVGEESGLAGAKALDAGRLQADFGYALDCNGLVGDIVVAAPKLASIHVKIHGKSAHAGVNPEDGISAIQVASHAISRMQLGRIDAETTANIGRFAGGRKTNIVCDYVEIEGEARSLRPEKLERQIFHMKEAFEQAASHFGASVDFDSRISYPHYRIAEDAPVVELAKKALRSIGRQPNLLVSGGGSDANIFNDLGIPTVNLAIGYEHIHTTKEQMPVAELIKTAELVVALIGEAAAADSGQR